MLKFCPECGSKTNGGKFCGGCGADLSKYGVSGASSVDVNANSTLDDAIGNLLDLAKDRQTEDKLRVLIIRGKFDEARQLCDELIDKDPMDKVGYIGLIRIASQNYKIFEGEKLEEDIRIAQEIFGEEGLLNDAEYAKFQSAYKQYLEEKALKLKEEEEYKLISSKIKVGDFVNFGRWPQSKKTNDIIIDRMDDNGYYIGSDGYQYAKVGYDYFKVENLKWKILKKEDDDGKILLLCNSVIEVKAFDKNTNEYAESDIREWLNNEFYNKAFTNTDKKEIVTTSVDNGIASQKEQYVAHNTFDNIFLLSWNEVQNIYESQIYGVGNYPIVTEYIKAKNAYKEANGYNWWWLRTTSSKDRADISDGPYSYNKDYEFGGVVPALWFQFYKKN